MTRRNALTIAFALSFSIGTAALVHASVRASLTGTWDVTIDTPQGAFENTWEFVQAEDGSFSGVTRNDMIGETAFEGGWVDGDAFGFSMYVDMQGQGMDLTYEGTFTETEIVGTLDVGGGQFTADFTGVRVEGDAR